MVKLKRFEVKCEKMDEDLFRYICSKLKNIGYATTKTDDLCIAFLYEGSLGTARVYGRRVKFSVFEALSETESFKEFRERLGLRAV